MNEHEKEYARNFLKRWYNNDMSRLTKIAESTNGKGWDYYKDKNNDVVVAIPARFDKGYACFFGDMAHFKNMLARPTFAKGIALTHR